MATKHRQDGGLNTQTVSTLPTQAQPIVPDGEPNTAVILDTDKYRPLLSDEDLTPDQEREYIETVWAMLLQAMLLGIRIEIDGDQICGQLNDISLSEPIGGSDRVESKDSEFKTDFKGVAVANDVVTAEGSR